MGGGGGGEELREGVRVGLARINHHHPYVIGERKYIFVFSKSKHLLQVNRIRKNRRIREFSCNVSKKLEMILCKAYFALEGAAEKEIAWIGKKSKVAKFYLQDNMKDFYGSGWLS